MALLGSENLYALGAGKLVKLKKYMYRPTDRQAGQINQAWLSYQLDRITVSIYCTY